MRIAKKHAKIWCHTVVRVVTRYVGSVIKGVRLGIRRVGSGITSLGSGITDRGIPDHRPWDRGQQFFRDQRSRCTIFVGSGTKIGHAVGIKDQKFGYKNGISDEKIYLGTTLN